MALVLDSNNDGSTYCCFQAPDCALSLSAWQAKDSNGNNCVNVQYCGDVRYDIYQDVLEHFMSYIPNQKNAKEGGDIDVNLFMGPDDSGYKCTSFNFMVGSVEESVAAFRAYVIGKFVDDEVKKDRQTTTLRTAPVAHSESCSVFHAQTEPSEIEVDEDTPGITIEDIRQPKCDLHNLRRCPNFRE